MINISTRENLFVELAKLDHITRLKSLLEPGGGYILRLEDGRFVPRQPSVAWNAPWVYVRPDPRARCDVYQRVFHQVLHHVHSYCRECWKVVVRPRTVAELFDLYELQITQSVPCKCGIELRDTVHGLYGGYYYCRGKEQGLERYREVRKLVDEKIDPGVAVILKRYCTEYEIGEGSHGPSNEMPDATAEEIAWEQEIEALFPRVGYGTMQPDWITARVLKEWILHAWRCGDETYQDFTGGSPLFPPYVTYHQEASHGRDC